MKKGIDFIGVAAGAMVKNDEGKFLIAKRGLKAKNEVGKWEFPGGGVDFGEKCEEAIKREMREEFGIEIEILDLLQIVDHILTEEKQHWVAPCYLAKLSSGTPTLMEPEKISEFKWITISEAKNFNLCETAKANLIAYHTKYKSL